MMISWRKNRESRETLASETTGFMLCCTSSHRLAMRKCPQVLGLIGRLRELDIELMRRLSPRVNVIPVIGKADSLTPSELRAFKKRVSHR